MTITLKYPKGDFTQSELATFNGMEKLAVYLSLREAVDNGTLVKSGTRATEGTRRPSNLYRLASNNAPVPVPALPVVQSSVDIPSMPETPSVAIAEDLPPVIIPFLPPLAPAAPKTELSAPNPAYPCPLCQGPMTEIPDATGVMVKCFNTETCDPQCHENPYGHSTNAKAAYEIARQKYQKPSMN